MAEGSGDKTEDATPKRIREARKKGQVPKSRDLVTVFVMAVVFATMAMTFANMGRFMQEYMTFAFKLVSENREVTGYDMMTAGKSGFVVLAKATMPILIAGFITALVIGFLQVGPMFSTEILSPKFEKLNPIEGIKNMFKMATLIELIKNIAKIVLIFYLAYSTMHSFLGQVLLTPKIGILDSMTMAGDLVYRFFVKVCGVFLVIALIDLGVQRWNFMKNMRMSKDEVKREYKEEEGDPKIKGERKRLHREMAMGDTRKAVKKADAVVTNPTHVAVAIMYDKDDMGAPEVLVKGQRQFAENIIAIAQEENIPIVRNIPLAWSLLQIEEGDAIPEDLYEPVAEVLSFVYELKENAASQKAQNSQEPKSEDQPTNFNPLG